MDPPGQINETNATNGYPPGRYFRGNLHHSVRCIAACRGPSPGERVWKKENTHGTNHYLVLDLLFAWKRAIKTNIKQLK